MTYTIVKKAAKAKFVLAAFVASFVSFAAAPGVAHATTGGSASAPASKEACKEDGWRQLGYQNQGQCIRAAVAAPGNGYGGNGGNNTNVNVGDITVVGDGNSVNIIVNVITG